MADPFTIQTGDPRFNAGEPVVINGHSYVAAGQVEALQKQVERLIIDGIHTCHDQCQRPACVLRRENEALQARCAELEAGLKPFAAEYSDAGADRLADEMLWEKANPAGGMIVTVGDFRRARTLTGGTNGQ